ncbi:hypothetical protein MVI27_10080 [Chryseobacterium salipaludis]|uniref:hypothetical protein n=1 Tax=Chryseobacterium TaxID=59732 RepID=UPI001FF62048|nr:MULTISPECIES: hypothetical protein [Chryseobacterium]MCJ8498607.1 hypothetical protein [Chryseobacterium salipaludis]MCX3297743.1 hypothetical protein [Planobacterium sp. JC490]
MGDLNIALNTILYVMIFIFPGFLFRKFLFRKEYSKEFERGNLFERTVLTVLASVLMLALSGLIFWSLENVFSLRLLENLTYNKISQNFTQLSNNKIPDYDKELFADIILLTSCVYLISIFFGYLFYRFTKTSLFRVLGIFKYENYWEGLITGQYSSNTDDTLTYSYTVADVLIDGGENTILYSGKVDGYFTSSENFMLQTIVLSDVKKYVRSKTSDETIVRDIPGDNMVLERDRILNLNLSYIYKKKESTVRAKSFSVIINTLSVIAIVLTFSTLFIDERPYLSTWLRKVIFVFFGWTLIVLLNELFKNLLSGQFSRVRKENILFIIVACLPYLWIFNILKWWIVIVLMFGLMVLFSLIFAEYKTSQQQSHGTEDSETKDEQLIDE